MTKVAFIFLLLAAQQCYGQKFPNYEYNDPYAYNGGDAGEPRGVDYSWWNVGAWDWGWLSSSPDTTTTQSTTKSTTPTTTTTPKTTTKPPPPTMETVDGLFERDKDGNLFLEGDMVIPEKDKNYYLTLYGMKKPIVVEKRSIPDDVTDDVMEEDNHREKRSVTHLKDHYWKLEPAGVNYYIPYYINKDVVSSTRKNLGKAFMEFIKYTCIRFKEIKTPKGDYLNIYNGTGCHSKVGKQNGKLELSLQNYRCSVASTIHELMHALGFHHEQSRADRDDYITILEDNVLEGKMKNFKKQKYSLTHDTPYDFRSIMHYPLNAFSTDYYKLDTIELKKPFEHPEKIGSYSTFSYYDLKQLKKLYPCGKVFIPTYLKSTIAPPCEDKYDWCKYNYMVCVRSSSSCKKTCGRCQ